MAPLRITGLYNPARLLSFQGAWCSFMPKTFSKLLWTETTLNPIYTLGPGSTFTSCSLPGSICFTTNNSYVITNMPYTNGCTVAAVLGNSYIGLTETKVTGAQNPVGFTYMASMDENYIYAYNSGVKNQTPKIVGNILSIVYNNADICFYLHGLELPTLRISGVGPGKTFYGIFSSITLFNFDSPLWSSLTVPPKSL